MLECITSNGLIGWWMLVRTMKCYVFFVFLLREKTLLLVKHSMKDSKTFSDLNDEAT